MTKTVREDLNFSINWLCRKYPDMSYQEVLNRCKEIYEQERHEMDEAPYTYIVNTWESGNKTHCKEYYSYLSTPIRISIAYQLGLENRGEIIDFINN